MSEDMNGLQLMTPPQGPSASSGAGVRRLDPDTPGQAFPEAKRRKIRKGTRSCWECKRRKIRCNFTSAADAVCIGCSRRGTHCVSQEYPEEASRPAEKGEPIGDRIVRVEALVEQLVKQVSTARSANGAQNTNSFSHAGNDMTFPPDTSAMDADDSGAQITVMPTPACSEGTRSSRVGSLHDADLECDSLRTALTTPSLRSEDDVNYLERSGLSLPFNLQELSNKLYAVMPSEEDVRIICQSSATSSTYFYQMLTGSYPEIKERGLVSPECLMKRPSRSAHPVILARHILILASLTQCIPPGTTDLSEDPRVMVRKMVDVTNRAITTNEELLGSLESLECIMLEGIIQANGGNLRRSWLAFRRAMVVGQLMGIHRPYHRPPKKLDPASKANPEFMWYRIMHADKYLCLMLGLPQGSVDTSFATEEAMAKETPMGQLERRMNKIAARILQRNEAAPQRCVWEDTESIDKELQQAAKLMPAKWWLPPNLPQVAQSNNSDDVFWETLRLINQLFYFNLLNQLHLPYMLRFSSDRRYEYSKLTCANASRELLSRFVAFRSWNHNAFCCRSIDFFALMAAMTLVLAHLDSHRQANSNCPLGHQRLGDRAMMEQVLENMDLVNKLSMDVLSEKSGDLLRRLLEIEADAAEGKTYHPQSVCQLVDDPDHATKHGGDQAVQCMANEPQSPGGVEDGPVALQDDDGVLWMCIPYFGVIKITRDGGISKQPSRLDSSDTVLHSKPNHDRSAKGSQYAAATQQLDTGSNQNFGSDGSISGRGGGFPAPQGQQHHEFAPQLPNSIEQAIQNEYAYPGLAAAADDWAFQGVDTAFFDSILKGLGTSTAGFQNDSGATILQNDWSVDDYRV